MHIIYIKNSKLLHTWNYLIIHKLIVLDRNTWNHINVYKEMIINKKSTMEHWKYGDFN